MDPCDPREESPRPRTVLGQRRILSTIDPGGGSRRLKVRGRDPGEGWNGEEQPRNGEPGTGDGTGPDSHREVSCRLGFHRLSRVPGLQGGTGSQGSHRWAAFIPTFSNDPLLRGFGKLGAVICKAQGMIRCRDSRRLPGALLGTPGLFGTSESLEILGSFEWGKLGYRSEPREPGRIGGSSNMR